MAIDIRKFMGRFVEEARDHLARLGEGLAALDAGHVDPEGVNALFRSAHTIKGSSRMLRLASITEIAHRLEDVLGAMREGSLAYSAPLGQLLYRALDQLADLVDRLAQDGDGASLPAPDGALCQALAQAAGAAAPGEEAPTVPAAPASAPVAPPPSAAPSEPIESAEPPAAVAAPEPRLQAAETVRVRLSKLDELIKLMGEVVSSHARMRERLADIHALERSVAASLGDGAAQGLRQFARLLKEDVQAQEALMDELHDKTLLMRMLPLAIVLEPAARLVRELARSVGKQVECSIAGTEIELDRQLIDKLSDPIIHLIRSEEHTSELQSQR